MPAQMIFISAELAQTLNWVVPAEISHLLNQQNMHMETHYIGDEPTFVVSSRIDVLTPIGISAPIPIVLTLCHRKALAFLPDPIPAPWVRRYLQVLRDAALASSFLSSHEKLELCEAVDTAEAFPVAPPLPLLREQITKPFQWRQIEKGKLFGAQLGEPLGRFDADLQAYDPSIGIRPCLGLVSALSRQSNLAGHLAQLGIKAADWPAIANLLKRKDKAFLASRKHSERLTEAADVAASELEFFLKNRQGCITVDVAQLLHQHALGRTSPSPGVYRQHDCGPDPETGHPGLPCRAISNIFRQFTQIFGRLAWPDCHPIIRAGLAHLSYVRIRPYNQGNGEVARLLLSLMLQDRGIPELPLDLILARRQADYRATITNAFLVGDVVGFLRFLTEVCHQALQLGTQMAGILRSEVARLAEAFHRHVENPRAAEDLAIMTCSRMIIEDHHIVFALPADPDGAVTALRKLAEEGLIDEAIVGKDIYWSSPQVRDLLEAASSLAALGGEI